MAPEQNKRESFLGSINDINGLLGTASIVNVESEVFVDPLSDNFVLPRFSSVNPPEVGGVSNLDHLRRGSFNYLHDNIDEETMRDPVLQRMPLLKNLTKRNLIPVIDFEEFNKTSQSKNIYSSGLTNNSARGVPF